ncbi:MAG: Rrf2 family transcriptional regulator, partial [Acidobacteria bacterium]|nr:Rrf2 family transcriptional regulator [Acidobacteriota bacterium]
MAANSKFSIAVHVLAILARSCDERIKSDYIAKSVNTNPVVIRRLLSTLYESGLVVSQTGTCGGSCLTRQPNEISLLEIYRTVSKSEVFALHPNTPDQHCAVGKNIQAVLEKLQSEVDEAIEERLSKYTLQDVIE